MKKNSFNYDELINCGKGGLFGPGNAKLPLPPMLMFDRITEISEDKGAFKKGLIKAELDIKDDMWFFDCHFKEDPVMPGCLGLDAMWQLVGFYLGWLGNPGRGRALGVNSVKFTGEVLKNVKKAIYEIDMKRILVKEGTETVFVGQGVTADNNIKPTYLTTDGTLRSADHEFGIKLTHNTTTKKTTITFTKEVPSAGTIIKVERANDKYLKFRDKGILTNGK